MINKTKFSDFLSLSSANITAREASISIAGIGNNSLGELTNVVMSLTNLRTYFAGSAFVNGGNSFGATATIGTNDAYALDVETSGTTRARFHATGGATFGSTTAAAYTWDFHGTMAVRDSITMVKNSVSNVISNTEVANTRYTNITNLGASGGWRGGLMLTFGVSGGTSQNLFWFNRSGALAFGENMSAVVEAAAETQLIIKCATTPSGTYAGTKIKLYTDDFTKYTYANGKIMTAFIAGGANGATIPSNSSGSNAPAISIGWQYHPLTTGYASDAVILSKNDSSVLTEIARFCGRDQSVGIGVTEPLDRLHISGNIRLGAAGNKINIKSGANASIGSATLVAGTVTVNTTAISANSIVFLTRTTSGGTVGTLDYTVSAGVSFTINSSSATDTSTVGYIIIDAV